MLKVNFLCLNGTRKPLLIHGFSPVNAWLLIVYDTAFYAIILVQVFPAFHWSPSIGKLSMTPVSFVKTTDLYEVC